MTALLTVDEVAARLRTKPRKLKEWLRKRKGVDNQGRPYYRSFGRTKLFSEADVSRIIEALPCPSSSSRPVKARRTGRSAGRTSESLYTEAARLTGKQWLASNSPGSSGRSNVVTFPKEDQTPAAPTFISAAVAYMKAGRSPDYLAPLIGTLTTCR